MISDEFMKTAYSVEEQRQRLKEMYSGNDGHNGVLPGMLMGSLATVGTAAAGAGPAAIPIGALAGLGLGALSSGASKVQAKKRKDIYNQMINELPDDVVMETQNASPEKIDKLLMRTPTFKKHYTPMNGPTNPTVVRQTTKNRQDFIGQQNQEGTNPEYSQALDKYLEDNKYTKKENFQKNIAPTLLKGFGRAII